MSKKRIWVHLNFIYGKCFINKNTIENLQKMRENITISLNKIISFLRSETQIRKWNNICPA